MGRFRSGLLVLVAAGAILFGWLQHAALEKVSAENRDLLERSQSLAGLEAENERMSNLLAQAQRPALSKEQMAELLRLRGQVGLLRDNLRKAQAATHSVDTSRAPVAAQTDTPADPGQPLTAKFSALIGDGQTLITGGWSTADGKRMFVLLTPNIDHADNAAAPPSENPPGVKVTVNASIIEVAEPMLGQLGLDQFKSDEHDSSVQSVLAAPDAETLLKTLATPPDGVSVISGPRITTSDGISASISMSPAGGSADSQTQPGASYTIGLTPNLTDDKAAVNMAIDAKIVPPNAAPPPK